MAKHSVALLSVCLWLVAGTSYAQQCLHGANESADQAARRREALTATRTINNIQVNQPGAAKGHLWVCVREQSGGLDSPGRADPLAP